MAIERAGPRAEGRQHTPGRAAEVRRRPRTDRDQCPFAGDGPRAEHVAAAGLGTAPYNDVLRPAAANGPPAGAIVGRAATTTAMSPSDIRDAPAVTTRALFTEFLKVGVSGFGGVLPFARRMLVEKQRWLDEREFNEVLSLSQFLPGPNIVNVSVIVGRRFRGPVGSVAAILGLLLLPIAIVLALAMVFAEFAQVEAVRGACNGVTAAASGLVLALALKMGTTIRRNAWQIGVAAVTFVAIGLARLPLLWVLAVLVPVSLACAWWKRE